MRQNENLSQAISLLTNGHLFLEVSWSPCANQHLLHVCKVKTHNGTNLSWWHPERLSEALYAIVVYYQWGNFSYYENYEYEWKYI